MTYTQVARRAALMESRALRAWAKAGRTPPQCAPLDLWDEWSRHTRTSASSFGEAA